MEKGEWTMQITVIILEPMLMIKGKDLVLTFGVMGKNLKGCGSKVNKMEKE